MKEGKIYKKIAEAAANKIKMLAVLLDPDKVQTDAVRGLADTITKAGVDFIFVGGSEVPPGKTALLVKQLKAETAVPVVLFPGDYTQITDHADAVLFLSLLSGRNPEFLIEQQLKSVEYLEHTHLEVIPTGYILVDGGKETSVQRVSRTEPIPQEHTGKIVHTAVAGMYMGKKLIYLEAGSGAADPIDPEIIAAVKQQIEIPLIVGGGIRSAEQLAAAYQQGADLVVIGNGFEENPALIEHIRLELKNL